MSVQQMTLFPEAETLPRADAHIQSILDAQPELDITTATADALQGDSAVWERRASGILIRREPIPFTRQFYAERRAQIRQVAER